MKRTFLLSMTTILLAAPLSAQQPAPTRTLPAELRAGRWGISAGVFGGGGTLGWFRMTSSRNAFTLDLTASGEALLGETEHSEFNTTTTDRLIVRASVEPGFRRYGAGRGDVASYFAGNLALGVEGSVFETENEQEDYYSYSEAWSPFGGIGMGIGVEWFPTDALSLRAQVGGNAEYMWRAARANGGSGVEERTEHIIRAGIGTTGLAASIWF